LFQQGSDGRVARHQCLAVIEALCGHFSRVIHPHHFGGLAALGFWRH
jgi:hypothetical protein